MIMTNGHRIVLVLAVWALAFASSAHASTFNVNPIQLHLSEDGSSTLLTVHNTSEEEIRFQLSTYAWSQGPEGQIELRATEEIIFFPRMMKLAPGVKRKVRIGLARSPSKRGAKTRESASDEKVDPREKTYRILVEELPSRKTRKDAAQIQVLTRMSIPIFVEPPTQSVKLKIANATVERGRFSFDLKNDGTVHTMLDKVRVTAVNSGHRELFSRELAGWYVLAAGVRSYVVDIPESICSKVAYFKVTGTSAGEDVVSLRREVPSGACSSH